MTDQCKPEATATATGPNAIPLRLDGAEHTLTAEGARCLIAAYVRLYNRRWSWHIWLSGIPEPLTVGVADSEDGARQAADAYMRGLGWWRVSHG